MSSSTSTMLRVKVASKCPYCRVPLDENGVVIEGDHDPSCADRPLRQSELKKLFRNRPGEPKVTRTKSPDTGRIEWEAYLVAVEENLSVVLDSELRDPIKALLGELSALVALSSAAKGAQTDKEGGRSAQTSEPNLRPVWAERKLSQAAQRLSEEAGMVAAWVNHPYDPSQKRGECAECGYVPEKGDLFCRMCGEPTLRAYRRCGLCGSPRGVCRHSHKDLVEAGH